MFFHMFKKNRQMSTQCIAFDDTLLLRSSEGTIFYIAVLDGIILYHGLVYLLVATYIYIYIFMYFYTLFYMLPTTASTNAKFSA